MTKALHKPSYRYALVAAEFWNKVARQLYLGVLCSLSKITVPYQRNCNSRYRMVRTCCQEKKSDGSASAAERVLLIKEEEKRHPAFRPRLEKSQSHPSQSLSLSCDASHLFIYDTPPAYRETIAPPLRTLEGHSVSITNIEVLGTLYAIMAK